MSTLYDPKKSQDENIGIATELSMGRRKKWETKRINELLSDMKVARKNITKEISELNLIYQKNEWTGFRISTLNDLYKKIDDISDELKTSMTLNVLPRKEDVFKLGAMQSARGLRAANEPDFKGLGVGAVNVITNKQFSLIPKQAIQFMANFDLQLLGNVSDMLASDIKSQINIGILNGVSVDDITRNIGNIITNPDDFKKAGKTVFKTASARINNIVRTETTRSMKNGSFLTYQKLGVQKEKWYTADDERVCSLCGPLDNKVFVLGAAPGPPRHPLCRCTTTPEIKNRKVDSYIDKTELENWEKNFSKKLDFSL